MVSNPKPSTVSTMSAMTVTVNKRVNAGMKALAEEVSKKTVIACAAQYGFNEEEALAMLGLTMSEDAVSKPKMTEEQSLPQRKRVPLSPRRRR